MRRFYLTSLAVVAALALSPLAILDRQEDDPYPGKSVLWDSYPSPIKSIDPATCGDSASTHIQAHFYEGPYAYHFLKRPPEVIPQLAEGMPEVSADGLTCTIRLKKGVRYFRNPCFGWEGQGAGRRPATRTVRAADFVLGFQRCADYHITGGHAWAYLGGRIAGLDEFRGRTRALAPGDFARYDLPVEGLEAVDEHTLRIRLTRPFPQLLYVLAMSLYAPVPREAVDYWLATADDGRGGRRPVPVERRSVEFRRAEQVVGTGPYLLSTFERKRRIVLTRNPEFREDFYPSEGEPQDGPAGLLEDAGRRVPFIDVLHFDYVQEDYSAWMRFLSRQTDASGIPPEAFQFLIAPDRELAEEWRGRGICLTRYRPPIIYWIAFNMADPILGRSGALRRAMCLAYDADSEIRILHNGRGVRAVSILPGTLDGWKEAGPGPYYRLDEPAAKALLQEARDELAAAGLLKDGRIPPLRLELADRDAAAIRQGEFIQQQFRKLGLRIEPVYNDWATLNEKMQNKVGQLYRLGYHADYPDALSFLQVFYSPNIAKGINYVNYANGDFDALYEEAREMGDGPRRRELYARMIRIVCRDCPVLPIDEPESFLLCHDWVRNVKPHPVGFGFTKYRRIDAERRRAMGGR